MRSGFFLALILSLTVAPRSLAGEAPNFLVIIVDDLNDWIGCLGGHPQIETPHIDALAARGVNFHNAHVQATYCGPSRISFLSGLQPHTSGCYGFERYSEVDALRERPPFPLHLRRNGYHTVGGGKIFHHGTGEGWTAECWEVVLPDRKNPRPKEPLHWPKRIWDWGPMDVTNQEMGDYNLALAGAEVLSTPHDSPLLLTVGLRLPHVPLHVPKPYFDRHPLEEVILPEAPADDLDDVPHPEIGWENHAAPKHSDIVAKDLWKSLVRAYLASIRFVDDCVGVLLQAVDEGPNRDNTIVILFSDHGFHLGEKQHWAKRTLWEETTRVPLIIAGPGIAENRSCPRPVGLIDLYPTLCDLAGLAPLPHLEGTSLLSLLRDPDTPWERPALTEYRPGEFGVRSEHWRWISYPDGSEELYDHRQDPGEWNNLASDPDHEEVRADLRKWLPNVR